MIIMRTLIKGTTLSTDHILSGEDQIRVIAMIKEISERNESECMKVIDPKCSRGDNGISSLKVVPI